MESLTTASESLSRFRQLTDGMTVICQDVNKLKHGGTTQCNPSLEAYDNGILDGMTDDSPQLTSRPFKKNNSGSSPKSTASNGQTTSWAEEMDPRDPLLDITPTKNSFPIRVYPVTSCTKESLNDAFTKYMSRVNRYSLRR